MTATPAERLLPCLRCQGNIRLSSHDVGPSMFPGMFLHWDWRCDECQLRNTSFPSEAEAIADANRRPSPGEALTEGEREALDWATRLDNTGTTFSHMSSVNKAIVLSRALRRLSAPVASEGGKDA